MSLQTKIILTPLPVMKEWNLVDEQSLFEKWQKKYYPQVSVKNFRMPESLVISAV